MHPFWYQYWRLYIIKSRPQFLKYLPAQIALNPHLLDILDTHSSFHQLKTGFRVQYLHNFLKFTKEGANFEQPIIIRIQSIALKMNTYNDVFS